MAEANPILLDTLEIREISPKTRSDTFQHLDPIMEHMEHRSKQAHRSSNQSTLFLYGKSGDGKSTTLNYLFRSKVFRTSEEMSETRNVVEYGCDLDSSILYNTGLRIGFVDTPGFIDTRGKDPENLATISHFIDSHPVLGDSPRTYPNIVLVVVSALDTRLLGMDSMFSKMLHVLKELKIVDVYHPNVIIAVTHAMYLITKEGFICRSNRIADICKSMTRAHFTFEAPVIFIENIDERNEMETEGDWRILPDGTRQPLNLFDAMIALMKQSGDRVGIEAVRIFFSESWKYETKEVRSTPDDLNLENSIITSWKTKIGGALLEKGNDIYSALSNKLGPNDLKILPLVYNLERAKLIKVDHLVNKDIADVEKDVHPYPKLSSEEIEMLNQTFMIPRVSLKLNLELLGLGYSRQHKEKRQRIMDIDHRNTRSKKYGKYEIVIPDICKINDVKCVSIDIVYGENITWYAKKQFKLSFQVSYVLLQVDIGNFEQCSLNEQFRSSLKNSFPKGVDPENFEYKLENPNFTTFRNTYGLFCTTGLYFGGSIEGDLFFGSKEAQQINYMAQKSAELSSQLESIFLSILNGTLQNPNNTPDLYKKLTECPLTWRGGDTNYHCNSINEMEISKWNNWTDSIQRNMVCLQRMINSTSLYTLLGSSPLGDIRPYAREFYNISVGNQTKLTDLKFVGTLDITTDLNQDYASSTDVFSEENKVLTRIEAGNPLNSFCSFL